MPSHPVFFDLTDTADERFDPVIEVILVAMIGFSPLALGAVQPWSEAVVVALAAAVLLGLMVKLLMRPDVRFVSNWTYAAMGLFVGLVLLQLVPLPSWLMRAISPQTAALRGEVLSSVPGGTEAMKRFPLSFYPEATLGNLRLLLVASAVFVVSLNVVRRLRQVKRMLTAISIVGGAVGMLALAQNITDAQKIFWYIPFESNAAISGPFVNHSHFAQFMNLSIGAAIALLLLHLDQLPRHRHHQTHRAAALARPITWPIGLLACAIVVMALGVFLCKSRAGMAAMLLAGILSTIVLASRRGMRGRTWIFVGIALAVFAAMLMLRWDEVFSRVASAGDPHSLGGRLEIARGSAQIWKRFPLWGTGLGSFPMIFPMFDPSMIAKTAEHADNEYAQVLVETGTVGLLLAAAFIVMIWMAYARCVRSSPSPMGSAAIGLGFGFAAILVHSLSDFGQHVPANFTLTAIVCALLLNLAQATTHRHGPADQVAPRAARWPRVAGAAAVLVIGAMIVFDAVQVWRADRWRSAARVVEQRLQAQDWNGSEVDFARLIDLMDTASQIRPRRAGYRFDLNLVRWKGLQWLSDQSPSLSTEEASRTRQIVQRDTRRVVDELLIIPRICPTYAPPYLLAGQLRRYALREPGGDELIRTAYRLAPTNPGTCISMGVLLAEEGRWDESLASLRRAVALQRDFLDDAIDALLDQLARPDLALQLAQDDLDSLRHLIGKLERRGTAPQIVAMAKARGEQLTLDLADQPGATPHMLASAAYLCLQRGDQQLAVDLFRRALAAEYAQVQWRVDLAKALLALGKSEQALEQARTVLRISPANQAAAKFLEEHAEKARPPATQPEAETTAPSTTPSHGFRFD